MIASKLPVPVPVVVPVVVVGGWLLVAVETLLLAVMSSYQLQPATLRLASSALAVLAARERDYRAQAPARRTSVWDISSSFHFWLCMISLLMYDKAK